MSFPQYSKYKDSGIDWVGPVPAHWRVQPFFGSVSECNELNDGMRETNLLSLSYGRIVRKDMSSNDGLLPESFETYQIVRPGDIVLRLTDLQNDKRSLRSALVSELGIITSAYLAVRPSGPEPRFLSHLLRAYDVTKVFYSMGGGLRQAMKFDDLKRLPVLLPPQDEQVEIADFLDHETARIDALLVEQQQLIELLKEKRQVVISDAVTKGLQPNAPMKPAGIEWLGEVPAHWQLKRLKHVKAATSNAFVDGPFGSNLKSEHFVDGGDVYVIESNFATQGILDPAELKTITREHFETIKRSEANRGDIIIAKIGAQFGKSSILPALDKPAVVSGNSLKLTVDADVCDVKFVQWQLTNLKMRGAIDYIVNGTAQPALSLYEMNNLPMLLPPKREQEAIVEVLERATGMLDDLSAAADRAIEILAERRTALIYAAVTGQIDVREIAKKKRAA